MQINLCSIRSFYPLEQGEGEIQFQCPFTHASAPLSHIWCLFPIHPGYKNVCSYQTTAASLHDFSWPWKFPSETQNFIQVSILLPATISAERIYFFRRWRSNQNDYMDLRVLGFWIPVILVGKRREGILIYCPLLSIIRLGKRKGINGMEGLNK